MNPLKSVINFECKKSFKISLNQYNPTKSFKILKTLFYQNNVLKSQSNIPPRRHMIF